MKKALLIVGALVILGALLTGAFAGGLVVGRMTGRAAAPPATVPVTSSLDDGAVQVPVGTPAPAEESTPVDEVTATPETLTSTPGITETAGAPVDTFDYDLLRTVLQLLDEQFYGDIPNGEQLAYGAIHGMLLTLDDPYTSFIEPDAAAIINEDSSGQFQGIGALVTMRDDGYLEIASVMRGQPAEAAGVKAGDIIVAVGDKSLVGLGLDEAISYIRGPAGTVADLEIIRSGEPDSLFISVTRAKIETPIVESRMLDKDIAYIRLAEFDASAQDRVQAALEDLLAQNPKALVFDLRDDPGGWLSQAIGVADLFLDQGLVAIERDSQGNEQRFTSQTGDIGEQIPMVVLVNGGSASASEIVAGALQDRGRAVLIGTKTLGKGSVQLPNNLEDGSQLRITIARWYTPNEQELHGNGLMPDVEATIPDDTPAGEDPQLQQAIDYIVTNNYEIK